ncbi:MAG: translation initiation factor IF-2, partial [Devosiaceae bacterium]|nr:translation initiation factor IF-2 [Devosiaceae bacterium]
PSKRNQLGSNSRSRLTVTSALSDSGDRDRGPSLAAMRRRREKQKNKISTPQAKVMREVIIPEAISVQELANRMSERSVDVIKLLMQQGQMATINDILDADTAELITTELGHTVKRVAESDVEEGVFEDIDQGKEEDLRPRSPVVTIMGHVDHGKTSLLDAIREANVVSGEAGGITQHIGAYQVDKNGHKITFLDTPGHEAFTAMRARGAQATDIAILVVAADDSVMPQTIESIKHAKAADVPIIVAINKIDKPSADVNKVRNELLQHEIFVESMGGEVLDVEVSALKHTNLDKLLETILLQAELLDLKANPTGKAQGIVIEAKLDKGRGAVATTLIQRGELKVGDVAVAGSQWARVRALINDKGEQVKQAGPSTPVEILGFAGVPNAGDRFAVVENEAKAREITEYRKRAIREKSAVGGVTSLEQMMDQLKSANLSRFPLIIKGDVQGSVEAINSALEKLGNDEVSAQILMAGVGGITESDITLAQASNAIIIGFNVRANKQALEAANREGIEIRYYNIIYDLVDDVKKAMSGLLAPERRETFIGYAEILEVFNITKVGKIAGCRVTEGIVERGSGVRLLRDDVVIHEGELSTLKRFKDEVKEVQSGQECGMAFLKYEDMRVGDVIECFRVEQIERSL